MGLTRRTGELSEYASDLLALDGWRKLKTQLAAHRIGMADRLYIRYGPSPRARQLGWNEKNWLPEDAEVMWIEWKRPGGKAKPHQKAWIDAERARGALVLLAGVDFPATPDGFLAWYRASGLCRRHISDSEIPL